MKSGLVTSSSLVALLVAAPLVTSPALAEPRLAQSEPSSSSSENAAPEGDSTWFEGDAGQPSAAPEAAEPSPEPSTRETAEPRRSKSSTKSSAKAPAASPSTLVIVDRGTTEPRPANPSWRRHDGFYLRMSLGAGGIGARTTRNDGSAGFETGSGGSAFDFMLGGSPMPGLTLGGGFQFDLGQRDPDTGPDGEPRSATRDAFVLVGPFIDVYPSPRGGFHLGGMLGGAALAHSESDDADPLTYQGAGGSIWLGYDWWVARQWSLGAMLRASSAELESTDALAGERARAGSVALLFTVLYH
jgi:hypothetical protein